MSFTFTEHHRPHLVPPPEVQQRLERLRARMRGQGVALAWIEHLADRLYYSGSAQDGVLLVPAEGDPTFFVRKSLERARIESPLEVSGYPGRKGMLAAAIERAGNGKLGIAFDVTPTALSFWLQSELPDLTIVDAGDAIRSPRMVKSEWEIEQIRRASKQVEIMFGEIASHMRPGMTELELTGIVEGRLRALGHGGTIRVRRPSDIAMGVVVSAESAFYPTNFNGPVGAEGPYPPTASSAGWRKIEANRSVMLDIVTTYNGYHADTTRSFFLGDRMPEAALKAHAFCVDILARIARRLVPGQACSEIFREVSAYAEQEGEPQGFMGYDENRVKFFGHGVGLELDELPVLADRVDIPLEAGMVVAVEPKAFIEGLGPVGVEDTFVVREGGGESLCGTTLEMVRVG